MNKCRYCGEPAGFWGFFLRRHRACYDQYRRGTAQLRQLAESAVWEAGEQDTLPERAQEVGQSHYVPDNEVRLALVRGWQAGVTTALEDGILSEEEQAALDSYRQTLQIKSRELKAVGAAQEVARFGAAGTLRAVLDGEAKSVAWQGAHGFNLLKSETLVWVFDNVQYYERKTRRERVGGTRGASVRVAKGVYFHTGGFKSRNVETTTTELVDTGMLALTDKHIYFGGPQKRFRVRYDRIVHFEAFADGLGITRDAQNAMPQYFGGLDGWIAYNLAVNLSG